VVIYVVSDNKMFWLSEIYY